MKLYLGLDGGGTKTEAALIDGEGRLVGAGRAGASNPLRTGFARALAALDTAAARALVAAYANASQVHGVAVGLAGAGQPTVAQRVAAFLSGRFSAAKTKVFPDTEIALDTIADAGPAVALLGGTGSASFGRNAAGETARAGGSGPWFSDAGSAFDIGRRALAAVAEGYDNLNPTPRLERAIAICLNAHGWQEIVDEVTRRPLDRLPEVFPAVVKAAESGDPVARTILAEAADNLAALAETVIRRLGMTHAEFALGLVGGIFGRTTLLDRRLEERLAAYAPHAQFTIPRLLPALAAARRALPSRRTARPAR